jgi:hypothetical protein
MSEQDLERATEGEPERATDDGVERATEDDKDFEAHRQTVEQPAEKQTES